MAFWAGVANAQPGVWPDNGGNMCDAADVACTSLVDGNILIYDVTAGNWVNKILSGSCTMDETGAITCTSVALSHATDCTLLTCDSAANNKFCWEQDDDNLYVCEDDGTPAWTLAGGGGGTTELVFKNIAVPSGSSPVVADTSTDTLTLLAGTGCTITGNATNDEITIACGEGDMTKAVYDANTNNAADNADNLEGVDWGTLTAGKACTYDLGQTEVDCASNFAGSSTAGGNATNADALEGTDLGTLTDTKVCRYDLAGTEIDCDYTPVQCDGTGSCAKLEVDGTTCIDTSGDRLYHDTDCDGVKDAGEEWIDIPDNINWTNLQSYPAACSGGMAIGTLGDTLTCTPPLVTSGSNCTGDFTCDAATAKRACWQQADRTLWSCVDDGSPAWEQVYPAPGDPLWASSVTVEECDGTLGDCAYEASCNDTAIAEDLLRICNGGIDNGERCTTNADCTSPGTCIDSKIGRFGLSCDARIEVVMADGTRKSCAWTDELGQQQYCPAGQSLIGPSCQDDFTQAEANTLETELRDELPCASASVDCLYAASSSEGGNATNADALAGVTLGTLTDTKYCTYSVGTNTIACNAAGGAGGSVALDDVLAPDADSVINLAAFNWHLDFTNPNDTDGALRVKSSGTFTGTLMQVESGGGAVGSEDIFIVKANNQNPNLMRTITAGSGAITTIPLIMDFQSTSPANNDSVRIRARMYDSTNAITEVGTLRWYWDDLTDLSEDSSIAGWVISAGSQVEAFNANAARLKAVALESTVSTGTPPLVVASSTVVTNLNADTLDGMTTGTLNDGQYCVYESTGSILNCNSAGGGGGDSITVDGGSTVDPDFDSGGEISFSYSAPDITAYVKADVIGLVELAGNGGTPQSFGDWTCSDASCLLNTDTVCTNEIGTGCVDNAELANNAVTYAKMQDIATDSLIGRDTAGSGDPENITLGTGFSMSGAGVLNFTESNHGDGANCAAGEIPAGVDAAGAVQGCYEPAFTDVTGTATDGQIPAAIARDSEVPSLETDADACTNTACTVGTDDTVILKDAVAPTTDGQMQWDSTAEVIEVGDDGVATLNFYPGAHATWSTISGKPANVDEDSTDDQPLDSTLTSIAALGTAADKLAYTTAVDTWAEAAITAFGRSIIDDVDEATFKATVNLEIGTDVQAFSQTLSDLAADGTDFGTLTDTKFCAYDLAGTQIVCTSDAPAPADNSITEAKLNSADTPVSGQCVKIAAGDVTAFEYDTCSAGSDTFAIIQTDGTPQSTNAPTLDFDTADFSLTESPADDFDIVIASAITRDSEVPGLETDADACTNGVCTVGTDDTVILKDAAAPTTDGQIQWDSTTERLEVGDDGVATYEFYPGAHSTECSSSSCALNAATTATTPAADDSSTLVATTAYVQGEINGAGGTNLTCSAGTCNVDDAFLLLAGDSSSGNYTLTGDWDFSGGGIEIENGTTPPACTEGQLFFDTDATSGQRLMACEGGTFVKQGDGVGVEVNDLTAAVTWTNVPDANVSGVNERDEVCGTTSLSASCEINTGVVGRTEIDETLLSVQTHATDCTLLTCDAGSDGEPCFDQTDDTLYVCDGSGTPAWKLISGGAGMTSFDIDGDNNSPQTITNGNEALFVGGLGIDTTAAVTDQITFDFDPTEITGARTWNNGTSDASFAWTFNLNAGTDPVTTYSDNNVDFSTPVSASTLTADDQSAATGGNSWYVLDNDSTNVPTGAAGQLTWGDFDGTATDKWCAYVDTTKTLCLPTPSGTATQALFATATSGEPAFRAIADGDIPDTHTHDTGATGATAAADDNDTSLATTAFVQQEINGSGGRSITCSSGVCAADEETYKDSFSFNVEAAATADDGLYQHELPVASTLTRVSCSTNAGTATVSLYNRTEAAPNTGTTNMMTSTLSCSTTHSNTTSFTDAAVAANEIVALGISASMTSGQVLRVHVAYTKDD